MVDVIRFYIKDIELSEQALQKFDGFRKARNNKEICYYKKLNNDQVDDSSDEVEERDFDHFSIAFVREKNETKGKLWFQQNIRRDYFKRKRTDEHDYEIVMSDLNYHDFVEEINYWADELCIDREDFWKAKVTQIELGVTLHFKTPMKGIFSCFGSLKNMPRKHVYENSGVKFIGDNYQVSIYDKLDRGFYTGEILNDIKAVHKNIVREGAKKVKAFIRYEIKITSVSGILPKDFGDISSLEKVKKRWNKLTDMLLKKFDDFTFVDVLSPEIEKYIIHEQIKKEINGKIVKGKDKAPIDEYLKYLGLKHLRLDIENTGIDEFNQYIIPFLKRDKIKREKEYNDLYEKFRKKSKPSYSEKFKNVLSKRLKSIRLENIEKTE